MVNKRLIEMARKWKNPNLSRRVLNDSIKKREEFKRKEAEEKKAHVQIPKQALESQKGNNILTLESKVDFNENLSNEIILEADGQRVKYVGCAIKLYFDGEAIRGGAYLERYDLDESEKIIKKRLSWFPPRKEIQKVKKQKWTRRWIFYADQGKPFFISRNESRKGYDSCYYRGQLRASALSNGINLSHELFETVFKPIDQKIMEMNNKFRLK